MQTLFYATLAILATSLVSLVGVFTLPIKEKQLKSLLLYLVSLSTGGLFGGAFFHLIPESIENNGYGVDTSFLLLFGIFVFFTIEKFIHWRHCHIPTTEEHPHPYAYMNLIGDLVHNFTDGLLIGGSFLVNPGLGLSTTLAVILHEIPQEIGDFGVLIHGGFSKKKALFTNLVISLSAFIGMLVSLGLGVRIENYSYYLLPFTAGGFIYIASSDLIPQLHKETCLANSIKQIGIMCAGIGLMYAFTLI
ncbi:ZIP family metal transporter [Candidatus Dojkabacteria bacterium]|nr:ZIP family metal transporter [Candidatus Dojkabacteria bacterium]